MPQKRRRSTDPIRDVVVVETSDGTRLRCSLTAVGRGAEPRWMLLDAKGRQFVGPIATPDRTPEGVRRLVEEWWTQHKGSPKPPADGSARSRS
jgi:hypothetical protein